ncbi:hypothetical protein M9H77_28634 [Catharanthus roseus]|uniref:Uncharacterized protein n=1 Tax=Catharanthus roseus TaxID=4058 RepID=A0ACC0AGW4_CATRO|nr:hypothetical protein M9H77_28634 [Catharanthus roseus]
MVEGLDMALDDIIKKKKQKAKANKADFGALGSGSGIGSDGGVGGGGAGRDVGDLKWYSIHYDGSGRPKGNADVVYELHSDALAAIRRYNNRLLDGNRLTLVLSNSDVVTSAIPPASHGVETQRWAYGSYWQHGLVQVQGRGKKRGHQPKEVSAEALDADLEKYREQAMFNSEEEAISLKMAEALVGVAVEAAFSKALSYATEEISGALDVRGNLEILAEELQLIQALLGDAETKSSSSGLVHLWLERLKDAAADADILLDEFAYEIIRKKMLKGKKEKGDKFTNREAIVNQLKKEISGKTFLLVLDDAWNEDAGLWGHMKDALQEIGGSKGSRIIVTTRSEIVVSVMNGSVYPLGKLSEEDSQKLFEKIAFGNDGVEKTPELVKIGQRIVKRCGRIPLAVKAMASLMSSRRDELEWKKIEESSIHNISDEVLSSIRLSFNHLPSLSLKQCLAFCSVFPKDSILERKKLIQIWMAHGLLNPHRGSKLEMEDVGNNYVNALLQRSLCWKIFGKGSE